MLENLNPFCKLLKAEIPINITSELEETFDSVNKITEWCLRPSIETTHSWETASLKY